MCKWCSSQTHTLQNMEPSHFQIAVLEESIKTGWGERTENTRPWRYLGGFEKLVLVLEKANLAEPKLLLKLNHSLSVDSSRGDAESESLWTRKLRWRVADLQVGRVMVRSPSGQSVWAPVSICMWKNFVKTEYKQHPWTTCLLEHYPATGKVPPLPQMHVWAWFNQIYTPLLYAYMDFGDSL